MLDALATPVGVVLRTIHTLYAGIFDSASGLAWGLSIITLTIFVRLLLFPLFVKQIKSQRRMQEIAPMVKELQKKHKGDRESLNKDLMALYKENNANPISGCLPLLLQLPVFFALFTVIREFGPDQPPKFGLSSQLLEEGGRAQIFGAPISANFRTPTEVLAELGANATTVRVVAAVMVVMMGATTFWTQRQMIARSGTTDPQQLMVQKFLLYVLPFSFAVSGVIFPIGVLLYWVTTNLWSMGQQAYVIKRMPPVVLAADSGGSRGAGAKEAKADAEAGRAPERSSGGRGGRSVTSRGPTRPDASAVTTSTPPTVKGPDNGRPAAGPTPKPPTSSSGKRRPSGSRKNKRRGGRR